MYLGAVWPHCGGLWAGALLRAVVLVMGPSLGFVFMLQGPGSPAPMLLSFATRKISAALPRCCTERLGRDCLVLVRHDMVATFT